MESVILMIFVLRSTKSDENLDGICDIQGPSIMINYPLPGETYATNHEFTIEYTATQPELIESMAAYFLNQDGDWILLNESNQINNSINVVINSINSSVYQNASLKLVANAFNLDFESNIIDDIEIINDNQSITLEPGWHMFGVPLSLYDNFSENLFPATNVDDWVIFNSEGDFSEVDIDFRKGYYLALNNTEELYASGSPIISSNIEESDISLSAGWNLFSYPLFASYEKYDITVSHLGNTYEWYEAVNRALISPTIYSWEDNQYISALELNPWGAYWINASSDNITIHFRESLNQEARYGLEDYNIKLIATTDDSDVSFDQIDISYADSYSEDFIYGEDEFNLESHIMPHFIDLYLDKREWVGTTDINGIISETSRFSHIRSIKDAETKLNNIGLDYYGVNQVQLSWEIDDSISDKVYLLVNNESYKLSILESIDISVEDINSIKLLVGNPDVLITPEVFVLEDSYPNPFNPTTLINLSVNQVEHINATIYNIHGQVVDVICNEKVQAGKHQFEWNAKNYSSGLYLLKVKSKSQSATQKLILIK